MFLGPNQSKVPVSLAAALQSLGSSAEYVILETPGANARDFHIAYYVGALACEIPCLKPPLPTAMDAQIEAVVTDLVRRKASKPRTQKTLLSTLNALFKKELSEGQLTQLFAALRDRGIVRVEGAKVSYALPAA